MIQNPRYARASAFYILNLVPSIIITITIHTKESQTIATKSNESKLKLNSPWADPQKGDRWGCILSDQCPALSHRIPHPWPSKEVDGQKIVRFVLWSKKLFTQMAFQWRVYMNGSGCGLCQGRNYSGNVFINGRWLTVSMESRLTLTLNIPLLKEMQIKFSQMNL